ncbi:MAG: hypothetical protein KGK02_06920 [Rhodospirillales bacterium]|nr:hypothetical protein [Rhodospirillales bacterium]
MIWQERRKQAVMMISVAGLASLGACASTPKAQTASNGVTPAPASFSVQTPIDKIAADERGKAVLDRDVPGVMSNPHYMLFSCMSLSQLASLSGGKLSKSKLNQVNSDLAELSPGQ